MTRDEILKMEAGREMDALIAREVMGWKKIVLGSYGYWVEEDGSGAYTTKHQVGDWCPSEDIAAAWQVVEKMRQEYRFELFEYTTPEDGRHYRARFYRPRATMFCSEVSFVASAYYPAVAICRAALLAVMERE